MLVEDCIEKIIEQLNEFHKEENYKSRKLTDLNVKPMWIREFFKIALTRNFFISYK